METQEKHQLRIDRLRQVRAIRGFTQVELSRECGIGSNQITRYENGMTEPSASVLAKIADILGVSADYLLGLNDTPNNTSLETMRDDERKLLEAYTLGDSLSLMTLIAERLQKLASQQGEKAEE